MIAIAAVIVFVEGKSLGAVVAGRILTGIALGAIFRAELENLSA